MRGVSLVEPPSPTPALYGRPRVAVVHDEALGRYGFPRGHPFGADRLAAFLAAAVEQGLDQDPRVRSMPPVLASEEELCTFHTRAHVAFVREASERGAGWLDAHDTPAFPGVFEAASTAVGATLAALRAVLRCEVRRAFVPIGGLHHARRDGSAGFCVFNDIGVAIEIARHEARVRRIAYVDIDAHHGDGVFYGYEDDPGVFVADLHQDGRTLYPGTGHAWERGRGDAIDTKLNLPLRPGDGDDVFFRVWPRIEALLDAARPELVLFQCGADSIAGDPLAQLCLSTAAHTHAATRLSALAERHCAGRLVAMGGGGYDRANLAAAWTGVVAALAGAPIVT